MKVECFVFQAIITQKKRVTSLKGCPRISFWHEFKLRAVFILVTVKRRLDPLSLEWSAEIKLH